LTKILKRCEFFIIEDNKGVFQAKVKNDFVKHRGMFDARAGSAKISEIRVVNTMTDIFHGVTR
jgi:hypothetical protein